MMIPMLLMWAAGSPTPPTTEYRVKTLDWWTFGNDWWTTSWAYSEWYSIDWRLCLTTGFWIGPTAISEKVYWSNFANAEIKLMWMRTAANAEWHAAIANYPTASKNVRIRVTWAAWWMHFTIQTFVDDVQVHTYDHPAWVVDWLTSASIVKTWNSYEIKVNWSTIHSFSKSDPMNHYRVAIYGDPDFRAILDEIWYLAPL